MDNQFTNFSTYSKTSSSPKKKAFLYVLIFALLIGGAIFAGNYFLSGKNTGKVASPTATPTPTVATSPTPEASDSATPTPTGKITPTEAKKTTPTPTKTSATSLQVEVLNGSGVKGEAGKAASLLKDAGYSITTTGNADTFDYQKTIIQIKKSKSQLSEQLKKALSGAYTVDTKIQTLAESADSDAIVIIGTPK